MRLQDPGVAERIRPSIRRHCALADASANPASRRWKFETVALVHRIPTVHAPTARTCLSRNRRPVVTGVIALLDDLAGVGDIVVDPDILETYRRDQGAPGLLPAGIPAVVARPRTTAEVQLVVRAAAAHGVPVVARGAGSGLSGGANAIDGCVVLSLERMSDLVELDPASLIARIQPGVINQALRDAAADHDLWYAPDPASAAFSTLGGNIATNAGGLCCVKYGVTRDAVLGLEVVLADGRAVRLGRRTRKGEASAVSGGHSGRSGHRPPRVSMPRAMSASGVWNP